MSVVAAPRTLMAADMAEQPDVLRLLVEGRLALHAAIRAIVPKPLRGIALVGRGSSANAALYGRVLLEVAAEVPVTLVAPSMGRFYGTHPDMHGYLVIGLSQSGRTFEIADSVNALQRRGAVAVGLTVDPRSPLGQAGDHLIELGTGTERSIPATKTMTAELAVIAMIAEAFGDAAPDAAWEATIDAVTAALDDEKPVRDAAARLDGATHLSVVAAGVFDGVAHEAALKISEVARIPATAWSSAAFRHGPMALTGSLHPVIAFAARGLAGIDVIRTIERLPDVPVVLVADGPSADIRLPSDVPEALAAIPAVVRAQQIALKAALRRHVDPDRPPRLTKVVLP